ncbi:MAG: molybdate ABC transporter substrate-binding protein [Dehalococcoidia bacterium]
MHCQRAQVVWAGALVGLLIAAFACGDSDERSGPGPSGDITVFAAASLTDPFNEIGDAFEAANPDVGVTFQFAGSPALQTQLAEGARADVLATADESNLEAALDAGLVIDAAQPFARNKLAIIVPADNPASIESCLDLANDGLKLVLAAEEVPAGNYARQSIDLMAQDPTAGAGFSERVLANVVSNEPNVKAVVTKVQLGEADAGIAYVTDVTPDVAADITVIEIPDDMNVIAVYPVAVTSEAAEPEIAAAFIEFVLSDEGQAILRQHGFLRVK